MVVIKCSSILLLKHWTPSSPRATSVNTRVVDGQQVPGLPLEPCQIYKHAKPTDPSRLLLPFYLPETGSQQGAVLWAFLYLWRVSFIVFLFIFPEETAWHQWEAEDDKLTGWKAPFLAFPSFVDGSWLRAATRWGRRIGVVMLGGKT